MRLSLWSSKASVPETKATETRSKASASTERQKTKGSGKKRPSSVKTAERYKVDDAPSRKRATLEKRDDPEDDPTPGEAYPLIDRVPTAMGYHSDGSEDEWLEEKSKCSRYSINDDQDDDDDDDEREPVADDEPDDSADRYSRKAAKEKKLKKKQKIKAKKEQPITISRLWSESTDSDASPPQWDNTETPVVKAHEKPIPFDPGEMSYPEERGGDPIYDVSKSRKGDAKTGGNKRGGPTVEMHPVSTMEAPSSPTAESDTSDLTDPLDNMLHFSATTKVVKEIEDKLKLLKKVAKDERAFAKKNKKAAAKSAKEAKRAAKSVESKPKAAKPVESKPKEAKSVESKPKTSSKKPDVSAEKAKAPKQKPSTKPIESTKSTETEYKTEIQEPSVPDERGVVHRIFPMEEPSRKPIDTSRLTEKPPVKPKSAKDASAPATSVVTKSTTSPVEKGGADAMEKVRSRDHIEMSRTVSLAESLKPSTVKVVSRRPLPKRLPKRLPKPKNNDDNSLPTAESTDKSKATQDLGNMYTRSLLTEDSEVDFAKKSTMTESRAPSKQTKAKSKSKSEIRQSKSTADSQQRDKHAGCLSPGWKLSSRSKESDVTSIKKNGSFWSKRATRASHPAATRKSKSKQSSPPEGLPDGAVVERKQRKKEMQELDEYSGLPKETSNEPDVVQCLRFYACGTVANQLNTAIRISECGGAGFDCGTDASYDNRERVTPSGTCSSPVPHVEVVLEELDSGIVPAQANRSQPPSGWNPVVFHDDDEFLEEAPPLPLSRVPSVVLNVSGMQLHLDCDSETERQASVKRGPVAVDTNSDVSITSVVLPNHSSTTRSISVKESEDSEKYNEDEEHELEEYIEKIKARKGLRGLFSRFRKS